MKVLDRIAVVRLKGTVNVPQNIKRTLELLKLDRTNQAIVTKNSQEIVGMLRKANTHITWGNIDKDTMKRLLLKRGHLNGNKKITEDNIEKFSNYKSVDNFLKAFFDFKAELKDIKALKTPFRLTPPKKGHEGIKRFYTQGGAMGNRGEHINDLLLRMI